MPLWESAENAVSIDDERLHEEQKGLSIHLKHLSSLMGPYLFHVWKSTIGSLGIEESFWPKEF